MSDLDPELPFTSARTHWRSRWLGLRGLMILAMLLIVGTALWAHRIKSLAPDKPPTLFR